MGYYTTYSTTLSFNNGNGHTLKLNEIKLPKEIDMDCESTDEINYHFSYDEKYGQSGFGALIYFTKQIILLNPDVLVNGIINFSINIEDDIYMVGADNALPMSKIIIDNSEILEVIQIEKIIKHHGEEYGIIRKILIHDDALIHDVDIDAIDDKNDNEI